MRRKITVVGDPAVVAPSREYAQVVRWPSPDAGGADVVVVTDAARLTEAARFIARRTPAAVVVATDADWCAQLLEQTCAGASWQPATWRRSSTRCSASRARCWT